VPGDLVTPLTAWETFYVIVGTSAGALTGLQFVAMALTADLPIRKDTAQAADAFATPTIFHFGTVLLLSGMLTAPWAGMQLPTLLCGAAGVIGLVYTVIVAHRARQQTDYAPVFEDWLFHALLPAIAYGIFLAVPYAVGYRVDGALFSAAAASLLLLFIGIHNAWDNVTFLVFVRRGEPRDGT
jgi:hypothetical protein